VPEGVQVVVLQLEIPLDVVGCITVLV